MMYKCSVRPGLEVIKLFSCSTELGMEFQLLTKTKMLKYKSFFAFKLSDVFIMLINVKMPTIVGILTFMSRHDKFRGQLSWVCFFYNLGAWPRGYTKFFMLISHEHEIRPCPEFLKCQSKRLCLLFGQRK